MNIIEFKNKNNEINIDNKYEQYKNYYQNLVKKIVEALINAEKIKACETYGSYFLESSDYQYSINNKTNMLFEGTTVGREYKTILETPKEEYIESHYLFIANADFEHTSEEIQLLVIKKSLEELSKYEHNVRSKK